MQSRRGPVVLIVLGILLMIGGAAGFFVGTYVYGNRLVDEAADAIDLRGNLETEVAVPGTEKVVLEAQRYQLVAFGPRLTHEVPGSVEPGDTRGHTLESLQFAEPTVTVTGPDGSRVRVEDPFFDDVSSTPDLDAVVIGEFPVTEPGTYTVTTEQHGRAVTSVGVGSGIDFGETVDAVVTGGIVVAATVAAGGLGFLLFVAGLIWLLARGSTTTTSTAPPPPPPGYGPFGT